MVSIKDITENKIPNKLLLMILFINTLLLISNGIFLVEHIIGFGAMLACSLLLYVLKIMSPGDVKLLSVIGYVVGWGSLLEASFWILMAAGILGVFTALMNISRLGVTNPLLVCMDPSLLLKSNLDTSHSIYGNKLVMPFAPAVTLGLAFSSILQ